MAQKKVYGKELKISSWRRRALFSQRAVGSQQKCNDTYGRCGMYQALTAINLVFSRILY